MSKEWGGVHSTTLTWYNSNTNFLPLVLVLINMAESENQTSTINNITSKNQEIVILHSDLNNAIFGSNIYNTILLNLQRKEQELNNMVTTYITHKNQFLNNALSQCNLISPSNNFDQLFKDVHYMYIQKTLNPNS